MLVRYGGNKRRRLALRVPGGAVGAGVAGTAAAIGGMVQRSIRDYYSLRNRSRPARPVRRRARSVGTFPKGMVGSRVSYLRKRNRKRKGNYTLSKKVAYVSKKVSSILKKEQWTRHKNFNSGVIESASNQCSYLNFEIGTNRFHDTWAAGATSDFRDETGVVTSLAPDSSRSTPIMVAGWSKKMVLKNNNNIGVNVECFYYKSKSKMYKDSFLGAYGNDMPNYGYTGTYSTDLQLNPLMSARIHKEFYVKKQKFFLAPGEVKEIGISCPTFKYDRALLTDTDVERQWPFLGVAVRIHGDIVHDTTNQDLVGVGAARIEYIKYESFKFKVISGLTVPKLVMSENYDTIADGEGVNPDDPNVMEDMDVNE